MAKVNGAAVGGDVRGTLGGFVFGKGISGAIIRRKGTVIKRVEGEQDTRRAVWGYLARKWKLLTAVQRATWAVWAENHPRLDVFGNPFQMSAINAFVSCNAVAMQMGETVAVTAPVIDPVASMATFAAATGAGDAGDVDLSWTHNGVGLADDYMQIEIDPGHMGQAIAFTTSRYTFVSSTAGNLLLVAVAGLTEGLYYNFRARYVDEFGQVTAWLYADATPKLTV